MAAAHRATRSFLVLLLLLPGSLLAQETYTEQQVKAAFLYRFLGFVEWPPRTAVGPDEPINIAVVAAPAIAQELAALVKGREMNSHDIVVRSVRPGEAIDRAQVVFVGHDAGAGAAAILQRARDAGSLTVAETPVALDNGAILNFVETDRKIRFEVALDAAERAGIRLSSRLLAVASRVRGGPAR